MTKHNSFEQFFIDNYCGVVTLSNKYYEAVDIYLSERLIASVITVSRKVGASEILVEYAGERYSVESLVQANEKIKELLNSICPSIMRVKK